MSNYVEPSNGTTEEPAVKVDQSIGQQGQDVTYQQESKWAVNGSGITQKEQYPPLSPTTSPPPLKQNLWDPKYSALGFVVIVLVVVIIDILPRLIRSKLDQATTPEPIEPSELQSLLVAELDSLGSDPS